MCPGVFMHPLFLFRDLFIYLTEKEREQVWMWEGRARGRKILKQSSHWARSLSWNSIPGPWYHNSSQKSWDPHSRCLYAPSFLKDGFAEFTIHIWKVFFFLCVYMGVLCGREVVFFLLLFIFQLLIWPALSLIPPCYCWEFTC